MFHVPNQYRIRQGMMASADDYGNNGAFKVPVGTRYATVVASDGADWQHVSVSFRDRCATWEEMSSIKALFWDDDDCVVQYHPPRAAHINNHPYCLHLWRPTRAPLPMPDDLLVGIKGLTPEQMRGMDRGELLELQRDVSVVVEAKYAER